MKEPFTFYRAVDPVKGSWDGYGFVPLENDGFLVFVTDAPSGASIQTPELIKSFWLEYARELKTSVKEGLERIELADGINRLQDTLAKQSRRDGANYQATLAVARKTGRQLFCASIGDSVLQLFRDGRLYRLTSDEVWDGALITDTGGQDQPQAERQRTSDIRFIGNKGSFVRPQECFEVPLFPGDSLLLHTDGFEDLVPPARLLQMYRSGIDALHQQLNKIFTSEKLKDDVTFLAVEMNVPAPFDTQTELAVIRASIESVSKEQAQLRSDLSKNAVPPSRLDKIERNIQLLLDRVDAVSRRPHPTEAAARKSAASSLRPAPQDTAAVERETVRPGWNNWWYAGAIIVLLLVAITTFLILVYEKPAPPQGGPDDGAAPAGEPQTQPSGRTGAERKPISPPEIVTTPDSCTYQVEKGETMTGIAAKKNIPLNLLLEWNPPLNKDARLKVGQKLNTCGREP